MINTIFPLVFHVAFTSRWNIIQLTLYSLFILHITYTYYFYHIYILTSSLNCPHETNNYCTGIYRTYIYIMLLCVWNRRRPPPRFWECILHVSQRLISYTKSIGDLYKHIYIYVYRSSNPKSAIAKDGENSLWTPINSCSVCGYVRCAYKRNYNKYLYNTTGCRARANLTWIRKMRVYKDYNLLKKKKKKIDIT